MLGKLIKYDIRSTANTYLPLYGLIILVSIINSIFFSVGFDYGTGWGMAILFGLFVALFVMTIIMVIGRFNRNLLGAQGYLMFTLPVDPAFLILSKLITSVIWVVLSAVTGLLSSTILLFNSKVINGFISSPEFGRILSMCLAQLKQAGTLNTIVTAISFILLLICFYCIFVLTVYLAISIAHLPPFAKFRVPAAVLAYFILNWSYQAVLSFFRGVFPFSWIRPQQELAGIFILIGVCLIVAAGLTFLIRYIFSKHLNLE